MRQDKLLWIATMDKMITCYTGDSYAILLPPFAHTCYSISFLFFLLLFHFFPLLSSAALPSSLIYYFIMIHVPTIFLNFCIYRQHLSRILSEYSIFYFSPSFTFHWQILFSRIHDELFVISVISSERKENENYCGSTRNNRNVYYTH